MNPRWPQRASWWLVLLASLASSFRALAQLRVPPPQEPQLITVNLQDSSLGIYSEGSYESTTFQQSNVSAKESHLFIGPDFGASVDGSIYHPNFIRFNLNGWLAAGFGQIKVESGSTSSSKNQFEYLGAFGGGLNFLPTKPLNGNLFAGYGRTFLDYDSFNRVWLEGWRYGGRLNYNNGPWTMGSGYTYVDQETMALSGNYSSVQNLFDVEVAHSRGVGGSRLNYNYNENTYVDTASNLEGSDQTVTFGDNEQFGDVNRWQLNTTASYNISDYLGPQSRQGNADISLGGTHPHNLTSTANFSYDNFAQGDFHSGSYSGSAGVTHHLYDSLNSSLVVRGAETDTSDGRFNGYLQSFGVGNSENYTKSLGNNSMLYVNNSIFLEHDNQKTVGTILAEQHTFGADNSFTLAQANVFPNSIVVYQNNGEPPYTPGLDYIVTGNPSQTIITRLDGGRIPFGASVLVNYRVVPTAAGSYDNVTETFEVRMDLWQRLVSAYMRLNIYDNNAPASLRIPNVTDVTFGSDFNWRWFGAGAAYEMYYSDGYSYDALRLSQSASFSPDGASTLSFNAAESWISYSQSEQQEQNYLGFARYHRTVTYRLGMDLDLGMSHRTGGGVEQTLGVARAAFNYAIGRTSLSLSYDYGFDYFVNAQQVQRHLFWFTLKRVF